MQTPIEPEISPVPWKIYLTITLESILAFYLATFSLAMFFTHQGLHWIGGVLLMVMLYLLVIGICVKRLLNQLSLAALMLVIPIAPLLGITTVISLIPVLEQFK